MREGGPLDPASYGVILVLVFVVIRSDALMYTVYVLRSLKDPDRYYVGFTTDLDVRLESHNAGESTYTAKWKPWELIVSVRLKTRSKAEAFEKYLKSGSGRAFCLRHF